MLNLVKFQILLVYMTEGSSVHGHVIQRTCAEHCCHISTWWLSQETGLTWKSKTLNVLATDILQQLLQVYGNGVMQRQQVVKWCHTFSSGRDNMMVTIKVDDQVPWWQKSTLHTSRNSFTQTDVHLYGIWHLTLNYATALCSISWWVCYSTMRSVPDGCLVH